MDKPKPLSHPAIQDGLVFLLLSVALFGHSLYKHASGLPVVWRMSPCLFPLLLSLLLFLLSLSLLAGGRRQLARREELPPAAPANRKGVLCAVAASGLYVLLLPVLTFVPATILFLAGMLLYLGERRRWLVALIAVAASGLLYLLFALLLNVLLP